jgi:diadenylate cyclase
VLEILFQFSLWSFLDVVFITIAIYHLLLLIRGTRTAQMLSGIFFVAIVFQATTLIPLTTVNWVISKFYSSIVVILIILFQEDIRNALSKIGKKPLLSSNESLSSTQILDELAKASALLAARKIGALIVIERNIILTRYIDIGVHIDARISKEIILSIFHTSSPIHDGAVIIQDGKISAAGCFLPLTKSDNINPDMGTRHRAAIGISQETDSVVILISEEKGTFSLVADGNIMAAHDAVSLRKLLQKHLIEQPSYGKTGRELRKMKLISLKERKQAR